MGAMKRFLTYGRIFALALTILFGCVSLGLVIAGFIMRFGDHPVNEGTLQKIKNSARDTYGVTGFSTNNFRPLTENIRQAFGIVFIVAGILSAPLVVFGFYTFLLEKRSFLLAYAIIIGSLVVIQGFLYYHFVTHPETVQKYLDPYLRERINEYIGIQSSDQVSLGWNYLMQEFRCCGVDSYLDLFYASPYVRQESFGCTSGCCKILPNSNQHCCGGYDGTFTSAVNIWQAGCASTLYGAYYWENATVLWVMIAFGIVDQIFLFAFAITVLKNKNCKVEPSRGCQADVWTSGGTQITQTGLPSEPLTQQPGQVISSAAPTEHNFVPDMFLQIHQ